MSLLSRLVARLSVVLSVLLLAGCGSRPRRPMQAPDALFSAPPVRVFVESTLADFPADTAMSDPRSPADIQHLAVRAAALHDSTLSMPHLLVQDRAVASVGLEGAPKAPPGSLSLHRFGVLARVLDGHRVELEIRLELAGSEVPLSRTVIAHEGELLSIDMLPAAQGRRRMFAVRPWIVRSDNDLRAIFERKMRERDAYLSEYERTHPRP